VILTGGVQSSYDLKATATAFVRLNYDHYLTFVPQNQVLYLIDFGPEEMIDFPLKESSKGQDSQYSLHSFSRSSVVFLSEKNKAQNSIKFTLFNFSPL
jgi:hypothetical protein